jgi:alkylation response protein AidB-like acyl-CoA dehydrogenase
VHWCREPTFERVASIWGYPFGRISSLGAVIEQVGVAADLRAWLQVAIAAEIVGMGDAALATALEHLRTRVQFGRPLASLQAMQHKMAKLAVAIEGARWLTRRAATSEPVLLASSLAATAAREVARECVRELHQVCGALGLSSEFDLHLWTTRLHALSVELDALAPDLTVTDLAWPRTGHVTAQGADAARLASAIRGENS